MLWPKNEQKRNQFLVTRTGSALGNSDDSTLKRLLDRYGGIAALAESPPMRQLKKEWDKSLDGWMVTGFLFSNLMRLSSYGPRLGINPSINKSAFLLEMSRPDKSKDAHKAIPNDRTRILKIWSSYKPVCHLCASVINWSVQNQMTNERFAQLIVEDFPTILSSARTGQGWALSFVSKPQKKPLLSKRDSWLIPNKLPLEHAYIGLTPLGDQEIEILRRYEAPRPSY